MQHFNTLLVLVCLGCLFILAQSASSSAKPTSSSSSPRTQSHKKSALFGGTDTKYHIATDGTENSLKWMTIKQIAAIPNISKAKVMKDGKLVDLQDGLDAGDILEYNKYVQEKMMMPAQSEEKVLTKEEAAQDPKLKALIELGNTVMDQLYEAGYAHGFKLKGISHSQDKSAPNREHEGIFTLTLSNKSQNETKYEVVADLRTGKVIEAWKLNKKGKGKTPLDLSKVKHEEETDFFESIGKLWSRIWAFIRLFVEDMRTWWYGKSDPRPDYGIYGPPSSKKTKKV